MGGWCGLWRDGGGVVLWWSASTCNGFGINALDVLKLSFSLTKSLTQLLTLPIVLKFVIVVTLQKRHPT